jgi:mannose-6-phosphate isomerase-like protein (cupin superfamily)
MTVAIKRHSLPLLPKQVIPFPTSEIVRNGFVAGREAAENERDMNRDALILLLGCIVLSPLSPAQTTGDRINLYFGDWHSSAPHMIRGSLEERDILSHGDGLNPPRAGAVFRFLNSYTHATLAGGASTKPARLDGQQEIYFVESGKGTVTAGGQTADLYLNVAVLMPANLEFTLKSTGDEPLAMYVINEPTPAGFRPNTNMLVRDENTIPIASSNGFWAHIAKPLFTTQDGLATLESVVTVTLDPLTIGKPHPAPNEDTSDIEEVWTSLYGNSLALVGNQLHEQTPGMAYLHIPDNLTPHTNLNPSSDAQAKFLYFARYRPHETRK